MLLNTPPTLDHEAIPKVSEICSMILLAVIDIIVVTTTRIKSLLVLVLFPLPCMQPRSITPLHVFAKKAEQWQSRCIF